MCNSGAKTALWTKAVGINGDPNPSQELNTMNKKNSTRRQCIALGEVFQMESGSSKGIRGE